MQTPLLKQRKESEKEKEKESEQLIEIDKVRELYLDTDRIGLEDLCRNDIYTALRACVQSPRPDAMPTVVFVLSRSGTSNTVLSFRKEKQDPDPSKGWNLVLTTSRQKGKGKQTKQEQKQGCSLELCFRDNGELSSIGTRGLDIDLSCVPSHCTVCITESLSLSLLGMTPNSPMPWTIERIVIAS